MPGRVRINVSSSNNQPRPPVRRRATPPVSGNLQVPRVPNIHNNSLPFRITPINPNLNQRSSQRTKSTRPNNKTKITKDKHARGRKRKTKVNVAKKSKRASQKKRGTKTRRN